MNFKELKETVLLVAEKKAPNCSQTQLLRDCEGIEQLCEIAKNNLSWVRSNLPIVEIIAKYENPEYFNVGKENTGLFNSGDLNSGDRNSGDLNSGDLNSGYRNSGYRNSGYRNSGYRNSGDLNSGYRNSGDRNSGDLNSGDRNSGDLNSGYRNSGVFCNRKKTDTVFFFNKESKITWDMWYSHSAYRASFYLTLTEWIDWSEMNDTQREENPKAYVCDGYLKTYTYHEAWANLWSKLSIDQKDSFKTLPNFDSEIFKDITGIEIE